MAKTPKIRPMVLVIRDGWGRNPHPEHDAFNAIKLASTPVADRLEAQWPTTLIRTSGEDVGLPEGTMGNSEVGHQNIGAGRVVDQESVRITRACREGQLRDNQVLAGAIERSRDRAKRVHLMGICSTAGVHGLLSHLYALARLCRDLDQRDVLVHLFTDGRDSGPFQGKHYVEDVEAKLREIGVGRVVSVIGRYWAMDRDNRWERVQRAYSCLTGRGDTSGVARSSSAAMAIERHYANPAAANLQGDEYLPPTMVGDDAETTRITDSDAVIFYNYRGDRPREIVSAFVLPEFDGSDLLKPSPDSGRRGFDRGRRPATEFVMMTPYSEILTRHALVAFPKPPRMKNIAGEYLSSLGLTQFRCAETEKYPHVTFFFNDYRDEPFPGEHRTNPQSPRVATYDQKPEMSADEVCGAVLSRLAGDDCEDFIVVNFANGDMVGHTGNLEATVKAVETVDACVGRIIEKTLARGGALIVTADHGNAEQMQDPGTGSPHTAHTVYDVPLHLVCEALRNRTLRTGGRLADIVPTALAVMGLDQPAEMTGRSLLTP